MNIRVFKEHEQRWKEDYVTKTEYKRVAETHNNRVSKVKISSELRYEERMFRFVLLGLF